VTADDKPLPMVLSLVSVNAEEERFLRSLLALLKSYLEPSWCIAARLGDLPDAILVDMDNEEGRHVWESVDFGGTPRIALSRDRVLSAEWTLLKPVRPGGAHSLTEVLQAVAGRIQLSAPPESASTSDWRSFAHLVRRACGRPQAADVVLKSGSALVVDPVAQVFYSSRTTDELVALLRNRRRLNGSVFMVPDTGKFARRLARWGILPRPMEELLWLMGLVTGAGESLGNWDPREHVRLRKWPDFASLPHRQFHLRMAAILTACAEIGILEARAARSGASATAEEDAEPEAWRTVVGTVARK
jgi:hypothetical protein